MQKKTGKVREIRQSKKVGTMIAKEFGVQVRVVHVTNMTLIAKLDLDFVKMYRHTKN